MARYIDKEVAETLLNKAQFTEDDDHFLGLCVAENIIHCLPEADVAPVVHAHFVGELVKKEDWRGKQQSYYQPNSCSNCHTALYGTEYYCPHCGAKMGEEK